MFGTTTCYTFLITPIPCQISCLSQIFIVVSGTLHIQLYVLVYSKCFWFCKVKEKGTLLRGAFCVNRFQECQLVPRLLLCKGFVLEWRVVDLDDALVCPEEILLSGAAVFLDAFNVKAQGSIGKKQTANNIKSI